MATTQDQQGTQGNGLSLPNIPIPNLPGMPNAGSIFKKGGQKLEQAASQAAKKLLAKAAMTPEFWLGVALLIAGLVVVALFLIIITTVIGQNNSNSGTLSSIPTPTPVQGQLLTCPSGDYATCLKQNFNISVFGGNAADLAKIFQAFAFAGQSPQYLSLLTANGQSLKIIIGFNDPRACNGVTVGFAGIITLTDGACFNIPQNSFRYLIIHESGHVIDARNPRLYQSFPWSQLQATDSSCYSSGYLKSYPLRCGSSCGIRPKDESFAESVANMLMPTSSNKTGFLSSQTINNFQTDCPATYNWFKDNVFGGFTSTNNTVTAAVK